MARNGRLPRMDLEPDPVKDYLKEIGKTPLLKPEQETPLAKRIEAGVYAAELLRLHDDEGEKRPEGTQPLAERQPSVGGIDCQAAYQVGAAHSGCHSAWQSGPYPCRRDV
jgi:hypothetical protein